MIGHGFSECLVYISVGLSAQKLKNKMISSVDFCLYGTSSQGQIKLSNQLHNKETITRGGEDMMKFDVTLHKN